MKGKGRGLGLSFRRMTAIIGEMNRLWWAKLEADRPVKKLLSNAGKR